MSTKLDARDLDELERVALAWLDEGQLMDVAPTKVLELIKMARQWSLLETGVEVVSASDVAQLPNHTEVVAEALAVFDDPPDMCPREVRMAAAISAALRVAGFKHGGEADGSSDTHLSREVEVEFTDGQTRVYPDSENLRHRIPKDPNVVRWRTCITSGTEIVGAWQPLISRAA